MNKIIILLFFVLSLSANESYYKNGKLVDLQEIQTFRNLDDNNVKYFKNINGQKLGITDEILVKCKDDVDCKSLLSKFSLTDVTNLTDTIYLVKIKDYDTIFSTSRELFESGDVEFAHPNFIQEKRRR